MDTKRGFVLLAVLGLSGCYFAKVEAGSSTIPIILSKPTQAQGYDIVGHFEIDDSGWGGAAWEPQIAQLISDKVATLKGDAAINVKIYGVDGVGDTCLTSIVLGLARHTSLHIEGDAIKFK